MGIVFTDVASKAQVECEFFHVECSFNGSKLPSYFLWGETYSGAGGLSKRALIDAVIESKDIAAIRELCKRAENYDLQCKQQREVRRNNLIMSETESNMPELETEPELE